VGDPEATDFIRSAMPMCATLGIRAEHARADSVVLELEWSPDLCTSGGLLHGGIVMALGDSAGGACASLNLPEGAAGTSTIESATNFIGAVRGGTVRAVARPLHVGTTTIVVETELVNGDRLVAKITQTQLVHRPRS
jgi:uncharacterized protein (TIGR00369 family)